jgi:hypothetical protein
MNENFLTSGACVSDSFFIFLKLLCEKTNKDV